MSCGRHHDLVDCHVRSVSQTTNMFRLSLSNPVLFSFMTKNRIRLTSTLKLRNIQHETVHSGHLIQLHWDKLVSKILFLSSFFFFFNYFESNIFYIKHQITFFVLSSYTFCNLYQILLVSSICFSPWWQQERMHGIWFILRFVDVICVYIICTKIRTY
jgi:hypothetical protein